MVLTVVVKLVMPAKCSMLREISGLAFPPGNADRTF